MELPMYFIVGERPVKFVSTPKGGMDAQAFDWGTKQFIRDMSYLSRCLGPSPSVDADKVDEATFNQHVEKLRGQARSFPTWHDALTRLLANMTRPPFSEWTPLSGPGWELVPWDDPRHQQGTVVPIDSPTSYVERTVAIHWDRATVHCAQYDMKTGAGDDTYDFSIPPDWLEPMKKLPWPVTGASSPF